METTNYQKSVIPLMDLLNKSFFIPKYQRGYRWGTEQVTELLDDIKEFSQKTRPSDSKDFYCLQPIVVNKMSDDSIKNHKLDVNKIWYEVLDGQQRLTTIFLIIRNIFNWENQWQSYALGKELNNIFDIKYETRLTSSEFLSKDLEEMKKQSTDSIDYFYMCQSFETISNWFKNTGMQPVEISKFNTDFLKNTKVIWYEVDQDEDVIEAFTRLNMNKIKLTNAELVKSLFLNSSNFNNSDSDYIRIRQLEIATEWDRIEYTLQNEELWGFLTTNLKGNYSCRIEYILDLISKKSKDCKSENHTFKYFNDKLKNMKGKEKKDAIKKNWLEIKRYFQTIEDWFSHKEYYHKVGYLLAVGFDIKSIVDKWTIDRKNFSEFIKQEITNKLGGNEIIRDVSNLEYQKGPIKNILLLHNVLTLCNDENNSSRFSFAKYKSEKWDVEHIHATADDTIINDDEKFKVWLDGIKEIKDAELKKIIDNCDNEKCDNQTICDRINECLLESNDSIENLCLLDAATNRSYKNSPYATKRSVILEKHKLGQFIPICTMNVFNKFYSKDVDNMILWDDKSKPDYLKHIQETMSNFLAENENGK